jgi:hypothetical protein
MTKVVYADRYASALEVRLGLHVNTLGWYLVAEKTPLFPQFLINFH